MKLSILALIVPSPWLALAACGAQHLNAQQQGDVALAATEIAVCQQEAHTCKLDAGDAAAVKCWPIYDSCMASAGLKDGGAR